MTLKHFRAGTLNSTKLLAFVLMALGIAACAYHGSSSSSEARAAGPAPPVASTVAWTGGILLLAIDHRKRRARGQSRSR